MVGRCHRSTSVGVTHLTVTRPYDDYIDESGMVYDARGA